MTTKKTVAIVVPLHREKLTQDEEISIRHLRHFLGRYDKYFVLPYNITPAFKHEDFGLKRFPADSFSGQASYNSLLMSKFFYQAFTDYDYILIYQLDSLVFSDQLLEWCMKGYDYIGAPWFKKDVMEACGWWIKGDSVGNGGFSLRRVQAFCSALNIRKLLIYTNYYRLCCALRVVRDLVSTQVSSISARLPKDIFNCYYHEDLFWSFYAKKYFPNFSIAPIDEALHFSFETGVRPCFEKASRVLPFGCHAWSRYDRKFWEQFLLPAANCREKEVMVK